jgi:hypothetical protein
MWGYRTVAVVAVIGLVAGVLLGLLTSFLAVSGPSGDGWSLRGNGALIVPFGLVPAVLAAGWTAIVAHFRGFPHWLALGAGAGIVGLALVALSLLPLATGGSAAASVSALASLLVLAWTIAAPLLTGFIPAPDDGQHQRLAVHLLAAAALAVGLAVGFLLIEQLVPAGS